MLGLTEIREFGATSVQVMRRLRALLEELLATVRPEHRAAVEEELRRLDATVADGWRHSVDLDRARNADRQGIGGIAAGRVGPAVGAASPAQARRVGRVRAIEHVASRRNRLRACERMPRRWSRRRSSWIASCSTRSSPLHDSRVGARSVAPPSSTLRARADRRIVAVTAPAGYGKSTLLAQWASAETRPVAWVSLDRFDDDPIALLVLLASAYAQDHAGRGAAGGHRAGTWRLRTGPGGAAPRRSVASQPDPVRAHDRRPA